MTTTKHKWKLENDILYVDGQKIADYKPNSTIPEICISPNGKYVAVCNVSNKYADIYHRNNEETLYLYTLKRETQRALPTPFILQFFNLPYKPHNTLLAFNSADDTISIRNAHNCEELYSDTIESRTIVNMIIIKDDTYIYCECIQSKVFYTLLYNIYELLNDSAYQAIYIDVADIEREQSDYLQLTNGHDAIEVFEKSDKFHKCYTLDYFYRHSTSIRERRDNILNMRILYASDESILHKILVSDNHAFKDTSVIRFHQNSMHKLRAILQNDNDILSITCFDNIKHVYVNQYITHIIHPLSDISDIPYIFLCRNMTIILKQNDIILKIILKNTLITFNIALI